MSPDPHGVHEVLGFLLLIVVALVIYGLSRLWARRHKPAVPLHRGPEGSRHVALPPCHVTGCPIPGYVPVARIAGQGLATINVCHGHADEGEVYGWWLREQGYRPVAS